MRGEMVVRTFASGVVLALVCLPAWGSYEVELQDVFLEQDATVQVSFEVKPDQRSLEPRRPAAFCSSAGRFELCIDPDQAVIDKYRLLHFPLFLRVSSPGHDEVETATYQIFPRSKVGFLDTVAETTAVVRERPDGAAAVGAEVATLQIRVPLFSLTGPDYLEYVGNELEPLEVRFGQVKEIPIKVSTTLLGLDTLIPCDSLPEPDGPDFLTAELAWKDPCDGQIRLRRSGTPTSILVLRLRPEYPRAHLRQLIPRERKAVDGVMTVTIPYGSLKEATRSLSIGVRFQLHPALWQIGLSLLVGALLGRSFLELAHLRGPWSGGRFARELLGTMILAVVLDVVLSVLVENSSELKVLGISFDPYHWASIGLVGLLAAVLFDRSRKLVDKIQERLGWGK